MPNIRLAVVATPRAGNTWFSRMLARFFAVECRACHTLTGADWVALPAEVVLQVHARRDSALARRLEREGFRVVTLARHPLDVLISILHAVVYDVESERWLDGRHGDETAIWASMPRSRNFVEYGRGPRAQELLAVTADYWQQPGVFSVRYEDLVADPRPTLARAEALYGPRREPDVDQMLADLSLENLGKKVVNNHFWKGQPGLWRELLPAAEAHEIGDAVRTIAAALGYAIDPDPHLGAAAADRAWSRLVGDEVGQTIRRTAADGRRHAALLQAEIDRLRTDLADLTGQHAARLALVRVQAAALAAGAGPTTAAVRAHELSEQLHEAESRRRQAEATYREMATEIDRCRRLQGFSLRLAERVQAIRDTVPWPFDLSKKAARLLRGRRGFRPAAGV